MRELCLGHGGQVASRRADDKARVVRLPRARAAGDRHRASGPASRRATRMGIV